jgi:hypothetical protein
MAQAPFSVTAERSEESPQRMQNIKARSFAALGMTLFA